MSVNLQDSLKANNSMVKNKDHDNERFCFFYEKSALNCQSLDEKGHLLEVNPAWLELLGYTDDEVISRWFGDFLTPDAKKLFEERFSRFKIVGEVYGAAFDMVHKDGHIIKVEVDGKIGYDRKGHFKQTYYTLRDVTKCKQAEEDLRKSEEKYRQLISNIPDIIWTADYNGKIFFVSPNIEKETGYTSEEFYKSGIFGKINPEDTKKVKKAFKELFIKGTMFDVEYRFKKKDGKWIWVNNRSVSTYKRDGVMYANGISLNITRRKQEEEALQESKNRYSTIIKHSKELYYIHDDQGKINYISPQCEQIFGYSPEEMMVKWTELVTDNPINQKGFKLTKKALETGEKQKPYLLEARRKDGKIIIIEIDETPIKDKNGKIIGMTGALIDITIQKQTEDALRESEEQFRMLFEYAPDAYIIIDLKGILIDGNKAAEKLTGYKKEELIGKNFLKLKLLPPDQSVKIAKLLARNVIGKSTYSEEITLIKRDGTSVTMEINTFPINIKGKNLVLGIARDITERKKYEDKIKYLSFHDNLTGLYNRTYFEEELARLDTDRQLPISIVTGDLNRLKLINDTFGHEQGDRLLCRSAKLLENCCRADDIIARWGGDEFSILLPKTTEKEAEEFMNRIKKECLKTVNNKIPISISLGFSTKVSPDQNMQEIIKKADDYMYKHKLLELKITSKSIISIIERAMFERSDETEKHTIRIRELSLSIGHALGLTESSMKELALLASLHDIGKIAIPESILKDKGSLTKGEWKIIKKHSEIGYNIAHASIHLTLLAENILSHHERWDGTGYPRGIKASAIPLASRIVAIVDAYDVMTHDKPYRKAISKTEAVAEIKRCSGTQFDPELVSKFIETMEKGNPVEKG